MTRFRYTRDPLFLSCCCLYALNRWAVKPWLTSGFFHDHFNDLLLIPCALPPVLWLERKLGVRTHDAMPEWREIAYLLVVWSILFELAGPHLMRVTGDIRDAIAYAVGGALAGLFWRRR